MGKVPLETGAGAGGLDVRSLINNLGGGAGRTYQHTYDGLLTVIKLLAHTAPCMVFNVPSTWAPLLAWFGHTVISTDNVHGSLGEIDWLRAYQTAYDKRHVVEVACATRPELVHALYMADTAWKAWRSAETVPQFPVTTNGSFFRREVQVFMDALRAFRPEKNRCIIVPCAADKPYPSAIHRAAKAALWHLNGEKEVERWHLIVATGVLGLAPEELWHEMPHYDSGIPNFHRVTETVRWYFGTYRYERIIVYSDFYAQAISEGFRGIADPHTRPVFVFGDHWRDEYVDLSSESNLRQLEAAMQRARFGFFGDQA